MIIKILILSICTKNQYLHHEDISIYPGEKSRNIDNFGKIPDKNCGTRGVNSDYGRELKFQRRICFGQPYHAQANFALVIWKSAGNHGHPHSHRLVTHDRDVTQSARIYACTVERGSRSPVYVVSTLVALANSCRADTDKRDKKRKRRKEKKKKYGENESELLQADPRHRRPPHQPRCLS